MEEAQGCDGWGREAAAQGKAAVGTVDAGGQIGDAEGFAGGAQDGSRGGHAVEHAEDFQLGLELVGDEIDGEVGVTDGVFDSEDERQAAGGGALGHVAEVGLGAAEFGGHHVFEDDVEAGTGSCQGEASSCGACADYGYSSDGWSLSSRLRRDCLGHFVLATAVITDS